MAKTRSLVYFVFDEATDTVHVNAVWGAPKARAPKLQMERKMRATLERYTKTAHSNEVLVPTWSTLAATVTTLALDWSATMFLERSETEILFVSASEGRYAVLVKRDEGFFDLIGDANEVGTTEFVHGGQPAEHPRRFIVRLELALAAAKLFFDSSVDTLQWERQGGSL